MHLRLHLEGKIHLKPQINFGFNYLHILQSILLQLNVGIELDIKYLAWPICSTEEVSVREDISINPITNQHIVINSVSATYNQISLATSSVAVLHITSMETSSAYIEYWTNW